LTAYSLYNDRENLKQNFKFEMKWLYIGVSAAVLLYGVFYAGDYFSNLLFNFSKRQVNSIYDMKNQAEQYLIAVALLFWIGPAEEIFWRGYAQKKLEEKYGENKALVIVTAVYAFVHIWAFNFMLFMAALICGLFWGLMYRKYKSVVPGIISHAIWDAAIFVILPIH